MKFPKFQGVSKQAISVQLRLGQCFQVADLATGLLCLFRFVSLCSIHLGKRSLKAGLKAWLCTLQLHGKVFDAPKMGRKSKSSIARVANFGRTRKQSMPQAGSPTDVLQSIRKR
jgi:hypothetical protein